MEYTQAFLIICISVPTLIQLVRAILKRDWKKAALIALILLCKFAHQSNL